MLENQTLRFGPYCFDLLTAQLRRGKQSVKLTAKALAALQYLVERPGQLVTKNELLTAIWPEVVVGDPALTVCIGRLRKALQDNAKKPHYIETVHRQGYRFIGNVTRNQESVISSQQAGNNEPTLTTEPWSLTSRLVGREAELAQLHACLEKARSGQRQVVFVTGEAGIGKTTVLEAFLAQIAAREDVWVARGQCIAHYGVGEAYLPVLEAVGQLCRGPGSERVREVLSQFAPTWLVQMPGLLSTPELDALQRRVMGATKERMLREMAEAVEALTVERGVVLWFDDLHGCDDSSLDLISYLARRSQPARLLVVSGYRPVDVIVKEHPLKEIKPDLQVHGWCEEISLESLSEEHVYEYLAARFPGEGTDQSPLHELTRLIYTRTEGNPLFMVNVVDDLVRRGVIVQQEGRWELSGELEAAETPQTLRQFIDQQVEQLDPKTQLVLAAASVAGMEFSAAAVAAALAEEVETVERQCVELARREQFVHPKDEREWPDGTVTMRYGFVHVLYQEVLYNRLLASQRINLHRQIGERMEAAYGQQTREIAAELAVHFEQGRDYGRAVQYLQSVGENALRRSAYREATDHLARGLELLKTLPGAPGHSQQELRLQIALGEALTTLKGFGAPEVEQAFTRAHELCRHMGKTPQLFMTLLGLWAFYTERAELTTASELAEQLLRLAQNLRSQSSLLRAQLGLGITLHFKGEQTGALEHLEQSRALYDPRQAWAPPFRYDPEVVNLSTMGPVLWLLGYPEQALRRTQEALTLARELDYPHNLAYALNWASRTQWFRGEQLAVQELQEVLTTLSQEQGFTPYLVLASIFRGWLLTTQGNSKEGIRQMREGLAARRAIGAESVRPYYLAMLAEAYAKAGQSKEGLTVVAEGLEFVTKIDGHFYSAELYRLKGELTLQQQFKVQRSKFGVAEPQFLLPDAQGEAEACFHKAIAIARKQQAKSLELRAVMSLSQLWRQQGKGNETRRMLAEIYNWFTEGFDTVDLREAQTLLDELTQTRA